MDEPGSLWIRQLCDQRDPGTSEKLNLITIALHANAGCLSLTLVSGDDQLLQAAWAEGLATDNPFAHAP